MATRFNLVWLNFPTRPMNARSPYSLLAIIPVFVASPLLAHAQGVPAASETGSGLLQVIMSLVMVLLFLFGSLYLLKKLAAPRGAASSLLRVIAGTAVGTRERVVVVEVGETWLVLGVAPGSVTPLHQLPRQTLAPGNEAAAPGKNFADWLKHAMERKNATS